MSTGSFEPSLALSSHANIRHFDIDTKDPTDLKNTSKFSNQEYIDKSNEVCKDENYNMSYHE